MARSRNIRADSAKAVAAAEARGKVRTHPPVAHTPMVAESPELGLGKVFHSYAHEQRSQKAEKPVRPLRFVPEACDDARLLPRVRGAVRR